MIRMKRMTIFGLMLLALVAVAAVTAVVPAAVSTSGLTADPALQEGLGRAILALNAGRDDTARREAVDEARALVGRGAEERVRLLEQLEIYLAGAQGTEQAMGGAVLLHALDFGREEIMAATLPHLVAAGPDLHKVLREIAATAVEPGSEDDPIALVLQAERLRLEPPGKTQGDSPDDQLGALIRRLARSESPWVRQYAGNAAAVTTPAGEQGGDGA